MENNKKEELDKISNPIFKANRPTYHLITEEKLDSLIMNSFVGSFMFALFSIFLGIGISEKNTTSIIAGILFLFFSAIFYYQKIILINKAKKSSEIKSFEFTEKEASRDLEILSAIYGTFPDKVVDVSEKIRSIVSGNKIDMVIKNSILEIDDPDEGSIKKLEVEYIINGQKIKKVFQEHKRMQIP
jgi:hypothetical protein